MDKIFISSLIIGFCMMALAAYVERQGRKSLNQDIENLSRDYDTFVAMVDEKIDKILEAMDRAGIRKVENEFVIEPSPKVVRPVRDSSSCGSHWPVENHDGKEIWCRRCGRNSWMNKPRYLKDIQEGETV